MLKIGEFSLLSRISIRMLRHYDEIGLLRPASIDPWTGYRSYDVCQLRTAAYIRALRDIGFGLSAVAELVEHEADHLLWERHLAIREAELKAQIQEATTRLQLLETARDWTRKDDTAMKYPVSIKTIPERRAATLRTILPSYNAVGMAWSTMMEETASMKLAPGHPCLVCELYHDEEFKEHDVDVEIQKTVQGEYADTEHVRFRTLPAVTVASTIHHGSYAGLYDAMCAVATWISKNGYTLDGAPFNIYHVSPHETMDATQFVTEVCYPVRKQSVSSR